MFESLRAIALLKNGGSWVYGIPSFQGVQVLFGGFSQVQKIYIQYSII